MKCEYCSGNGVVRTTTKEHGDLAVCNICWTLLKNPATALPLIRGNLSMALRGSMPEPDLKRALDAFMAGISAFKPRN